jgi:hypothetical protein
VALTAASLLVVLSACHADPVPSPTATATTSTPSTSTSTTPGSSGPGGDPWAGVTEILDPRISESSGLARSTRHRGVFYTHNDRGASSDVFAIDSTGTRAVLHLDVRATDWEDIATTPDGRVWVADTGDNDLVRPSVSILVFEEPDLLTSTTVPFTTYTLVYPNGPQDAEALLVDPRDTRVYVATKSPDGGSVYAAPEQLDDQGPNSLELVADAPVGVSGGDFSPDGSLVALRNQGRAFFATRLGEEYVALGLPRMPQGESLTFTVDGSAVFVGSEGVHSEILRVPVPARRLGLS